MDDVVNWFSARDSNEHRQNALGRCYKALVKETGVGWSRQGMEKQKCGRARHGKAKCNGDCQAGEQGMEKQKCNGDCRAGEQGKAEMQWVPGGANGQHNFAGMDDWFSARNSNEHRQNALGCQRYNSVAARKRFVKETGVRWSWQGMEKQKFLPTPSQFMVIYTTVLRYRRTAEGQAVTDEHHDI
ncbi:22092_t:CDS:2 [Rhizophagus irregularis]|nr:22092_t:CDS:2 [Rhizophagus irregularis]